MNLVLRRVHSPFFKHLLLCKKSIQTESYNIPDFCASRCIFYFCDCVRFNVNVFTPKFFNYFNVSKSKRFFEWKFSQLNIMFKHISTDSGYSNRFLHRRTDSVKNFNYLMQHIVLTKIVKRFYHFIGHHKTMENGVDSAFDKHRSDIFI